MKRLLFSLLAPLCFSLPAYGNVSLSYSGGNGTPLVVSLTTPAEYVVGATAANAPFFVFDGTGGVFGVNGTAVTSTITYTIDGGSALTLTRLGSGRAANDVTGDDSYLFSLSLPGLSVGDVVRLSSGTVTTSANFAGAPPAGGSYSTFISAQNGIRISTFGTAVPEPGSVALLAAGAVVAAGAVARRRARG